MLTSSHPIYLPGPLEEYDGGGHHAIHHPLLEQSRGPDASCHFDRGNFHCGIPHIPMEKPP